MVKTTFLSLILVFCCLGAHAQSKLQVASMKAYEAKEYARAATGFYRLSREAKTNEQRIQAKYFLGLSLVKLDLNQVASFPLVSVVRAGKGPYQKKALNQLALIAKRIDEKALLQYSVSRLSPEDLTDMSKSVFYLSMSEIAEGNGQIDEAIKWAQSALDADQKNEEAIYQLGSLSLMKPAPEQALKYFSILWKSTDRKR